MTLSKLDAEQLYFATIAGCHAVIREREMLNAINVFPIQDGDTGDNMAATANAVISHATLKQSIKDTLQSVAYASMTGARGNSGMIFSQFFNALADFAVEDEHLNMHRFSELLQNAATRVRAAILNPIDGTMLTIMENWSTYTFEAAQQVPCFRTALQTITIKLQQAVTETTQALAALQAANVVDAGALGFFHFVNGFSRFIADPSSLSTLQTNHDALPAPHLDFCATQRPEHGRFCTEAMLSHEHLDQNLLMDTLKQHGDSIVVSSNTQQCRFHLHTDKPWEVFETLQTMGRIHHPKIDDMLRQYQTINERLHSIAIVTDSNADLPWAFYDEHQIHIIPLNVHIEEHDLLDRFGIQSSQFYKNLDSYHSHPKTSCPSTLSIEQKLKPLAEKYEHVLILSIAQVLSGTHDTIKHISEKYPNMHVINTKRCSAAQGLLVTEAAQAIQSGLSIDAVIEKIDSLISKTEFWFMVHEMTALIRSGRINKIIGKMAQLSGLKPIFSMMGDGKAHLAGQAFSEPNALQKILHQIELRIEAGERLKAYCLVHAGAPDIADLFAQKTTEILGFPPVYIESVSVTVGVHAGSGCVGLAAIFE
jgi:uncharacterized protein